MCCPGSRLGPIFQVKLILLLGIKFLAKWWAFLTFKSFKNWFVNLVHKNLVEFWTETPCGETFLDNLIWAIWNVRSDCQVQVEHEEIERSNIARSPVGCGETLIGSCISSWRFGLQLLGTTYVGCQAACLGVFNGTNNTKPNTNTNTRITT